MPIDGGLDLNIKVAVAGGGAAGGPVVLSLGALSEVPLSFFTLGLARTRPTRIHNGA